MSTAGWQELCSTANEETGTVSGKMRAFRGFLFLLLRLISSLVIVVLIWWLVCRYSGVNEGLAPGPWRVWQELVYLFCKETLLQDIAWSVARVLLGLALGGSFAVVVGVLSGRSPHVNWLLTPILNGLRALPPVAIVPLSIVWVGLGEPAKFAVTAWAAFFPVWLNTHEGVSSVPRITEWAARSLGARGSRLLFHVTLPAATAQILVGFRLAISTAVICVVVAETSGASAGVGHRLSVAHTVFRVDTMVACLIVLASIGVLADFVFVFARGWLFPWIAIARGEER